MYINSDVPGLAQTNQPATKPLRCWMHPSPLCTCLLLKCCSGPCSARTQALLRNHQSMSSMPNILVYS